MSITSQGTKTCFNCGADDNESSAKFCGSCGAGWNFTHADSVPSPQMGNLRAPLFAQVQQKVAPAVSEELQLECGKLMILLARERIFLYTHWLLFIFFNLLGCWLSYKCYGEFIGDEVSKIMIAATPFLFINTIALMFIVPIRGTRREIARLKERLSYVRFKIDFGHLMN